MEKHEMILRESDPSGVEEWYCPTCGRRMTINWHPWTKTILEPGDDYAAHSAMKGGLRLEALEINVADGSASTETEDRYLAPWQRWMEKFSSDHPGDNQVQ
jgi:hypothetical protein